MLTAPPANRAQAAPALDMVELPPGSFLMGATDDDKFANLLERPRHRVEIAHRFALSRTPITVAQWNACAAPADRREGPPDLPVINVSWRDAQRYLQRLRELTGEAYRLPTEAEWEYACRAGSLGVFHTGRDLTPEQANYLYTELGVRVGPGRLTPVGAYPANAFGLHDMHGNAAELVEDHWHDGYTDAPTDGSAWIDPPDVVNSLRVARGGAWDLLPRLLRCAYRDWIDERTRLDNTGFRVALTLRG